MMPVSAARPLVIMRILNYGKKLAISDQVPAGYVSPALHRTEIGNLPSSMFGWYSLAFKLMPKSMTILNCSEMRAAGHGVEPSISDRTQLINSLTGTISQDSIFLWPNTEPMKPLWRRRKNNGRCKPLPPSKILRLEAQRVLKQRVQDIADKKSITLRFHRESSAVTILKAPETFVSSMFV
ncbi:2-oxoglutarate (2OG) and Fe(II)-dependent oxygenase superfamily protein [Actinidia rufa]|uniref:2-oxoglutarate (2OG) and Fe(II)-dependent oxygenase superfamily protein n=1 Tax=Actinidia rufa TaxID=165716 RepID=A0A7J0DKI9_9ERIC|nr:2-oxoglutarate (2OG) and Fe(II)-dependent oxygenase superfamily protein [Actinidia rufa]